MSLCTLDLPGRVLSSLCYSAIFLHFHSYWLGWRSSSAKNPLNKSKIKGLVKFIKSSARLWDQLSLKMLSWNWYEKSFEQLILSYNITTKIYEHCQKYLRKEACKKMGYPCDRGNSHFRSLFSCQRHSVLYFLSRVAIENKPSFQT